jgi:mannose-6-phosphate isomerase-like protein (cupin superfamily)
METDMTEINWSMSLADIAAQLPDDPDVMRFHYALRHKTMKIGLYAPVELDRQGPHRQDELYIVVAGSGFFVKGDERRAFGAGDAVFVEAGIPHRFENFTPDFITWVIFWGPEGGEADSNVAGVS